MTEQFTSEWRPILMASVLPTEDVPEWLTRVAVPIGWRVGRYNGSDTGQPWRVAVRGSQSDGSWNACETITALGFTELLVPDVLRRNCERTLRDLGAASITTVDLPMPAADGVYAVCSSGYFVVNGRLIWGQYSYFVADSDSPNQGCLVQQCLFVETSMQVALEAEIAQLSNAVHGAFVTSLSR